MTNQTEPAKGEPDAAPTRPTHYATNYEIIHRLPLPDGREMILGHAPGKTPDPYCTAAMYANGDGQGRYHATRERAFEVFARRFAEHLGVTVIPNGAVVVHYRDRELLLTDARTAEDAADDWMTEEPDAQTAGDALMNATRDLGRRLQALGVFPYEGIPEWQS